jgi:hypothetical protein
VVRVVPAFCGGVQILADVDAVLGEKLLMDWERWTGVRVGNDLDPPSIGADQHDLLLDEPFGGMNPKAGFAVWRKTQSPGLTASVPMFCRLIAASRSATVISSPRLRLRPPDGHEIEQVEARKAELLKVPYLHVVFTLPPKIGAIAYQNKPREHAPKRRAGPVDPVQSGAHGLLTVPSSR